MLNIALPKGRLGNQTQELFSKAGYSFISAGTARKLVIENAAAGIRYLLVKPSDVAIYVEHGAADIGVVGRDILMETQPDVYELTDLKLGKCKFSMAAIKGWSDDPQLPLRVASKYPNVTIQYFGAKNRQIEIIKLNGSIELAPMLGLSDVIVDIVQTGRTLKENNLSIIHDIALSSAWLIANKSSYQFKKNQICEIKSKLEAAL